MMVLIILGIAVLVILAFVFGYYLGHSKTYEQDVSGSKDLADVIRQHHEQQQYIHQNGIL